MSTTGWRSGAVSTTQGRECQALRLRCYEIGAGAASIVLPA
ncbi:hypothetical protein [uncultured Chloroflexus sp.]|nr:hypothetical protein [uncultured Chloroflexus sp.]